MRRLLVLLPLLLLLLALPSAAADDVALYKQADQPIPARVQDLLGRMTLAEKAAQLGYPCGNGYKGCDDGILKVNPLGVGGLATTSINCSNSLQRVLMTKTRLGIPASFFAETTHSGGAPGTTVFPMPCSQGASWNATLVGQIAAINALELRSSGGDHGLSPILQVCTDPRFGRMEENFSEDPLLVSEYGIAAVGGLQGSPSPSSASSSSSSPGAATTYIDEPTRHVTSQAKHFAMYGAGPKDGYTPFGGGPTERTLFEVYLRPWREFALSGGRGVMASHNMINWVPAHANRRMLTDTLRNRFGLRSGYVGSDNTNVEGLAGYFRGFALNDTDAAIVAMHAGVDQDMPGASFLEADKYVEAGLLDNATLDRAVANILAKKFAMRLFDQPALDPAMAANINAEPHRAAAREAAIQGSVLLKNDGGTLPLKAKGHNKPQSETGGLKIAVVGPFGDGPMAETAMLGGYSSGPGSSGRTTVTVAAGLAARSDVAQVTVVQGASGGRGGPGQPTPGGKNDMAAAVAASKAADFTVVVVGTMACGCCGRCGNGEAGDRQNLDLEGDQLALVEAIANVTGSSSFSASASASAPAPANFAVVLVHGRPVTWGNDDDNALLDRVPALLAAWRPGEQGGHAIADLLFGDANPSAKLAQAWPRSAGHIHGPSNPWYQTHSAMTGGNYFGNGDGTPLSALFPFGFGLSYTTFDFQQPGSKPAVSALSQPMAHGLGLRDTTFDVAVAVTNTGTVAGSTPVMVTFAKKTRMVVRYLRQLAGFTKVHLEPGETRTVIVRIRVSDLARYDEVVLSADLDGKPVTGAYVVDPGSYVLYAGGCVSVGQVWDDGATCPKSQQLEIDSLSLPSPTTAATSSGGSGSSGGSSTVEAVVDAAPKSSAAPMPDTPFLPPAPWVFL